MSISTEKDQTNSTGMAAVLAVLAAATIGSVLFQGFDFPTSNNVFHIPIIFDYAGSAEGPSDDLHRSLGSYVTGFWPALGLITTEANIFELFLSFHVIARFAMALVIWRLIVELGASSLWGVIVTGLLFFFDTFLGSSPVGENEMMEGYLTHSQIVVPFILGSWLLLLKERYILAAFLLGIAFNINAFIAVWAGGIAGVAFITTNWPMPFAVFLRRSVQMLAGFAVMGLPTVVWILKSTSSRESVAGFSYREYVRDYYPNHNFVDVQWDTTSAVFLAIVATLIVLGRARINWSRHQSATMYSILSTLTVILAAGAVLPYLSNNQILFTLYPLRMDAYLVLLLGLIVASWCVASWSAPRATDRRASTLALTGLANGNSVFVISGISETDKETHAIHRIAVTSIIGFAGLAHISFGHAPTLVSQWGPLAVSSLALQLCAVGYFLAVKKQTLWQSICLVSLATLGVLPPVETTIQDAGLLAAYAGCALAFAQANLRMPLVGLSVLGTLAATGFRPDWLLVSMAVYLAVPAIHFLGVLFSLPPHFFRFSHWRTAIAAIILFGAIGAATMISRGGLSSDPIPAQDAIDAQLWARNNTPPNTMFLPVEIDGFSTLSRRPVWVDWKTGAMVMWAPETHALWSTRIAELRKVETLTDAVALARSHNIGYIVHPAVMSETTTPPQSCPVYQNSTLTIRRTDCAD